MMIAPTLSSSFDEVKQDRNQHISETVDSAAATLKRLFRCWMALPLRV
jgi:hypothetical protein